jgi:hypothetical protein
MSAEQEPSLPLNFSNGEKIDLTYRNTYLYTFLGKTAIGDIAFENSNANHVFIETGKDENNNPSGVYLFEKFHRVYGQIAEFVVENSLPQILNRRDVPACDLNQYTRASDIEAQKFAAKLEAVDPSDF